MTKSTSIASAGPPPPKPVPQLVAFVEQVLQPLLYCPRADALMLSHLVLWYPSGAQQVVQYPSFHEIVAESVFGDVYIQPESTSHYHDRSQLIVRPVSCTPGRVLLPPSHVPDYMSNVLCRVDRIADFAKQTQLLSHDIVFVFFVGHKHS